MALIGEGKTLLVAASLLQIFMVVEKTLGCFLKKRSLLLCFPSTPDIPQTQRSPLFSRLQSF